MGPAPSLTQIDRPADLDRDVASFHRALGQLIRVVRFRDRDCICCYDLSVTQGEALAELVHRGPLTVNALAGRLYLDKSTTSRVVDALRRKGYVERAPHPGDGRSVQLGATAAGRKLNQRIERDVHQTERALLGEFEPPVREALTGLLVRLASAAARKVDTTGGMCCRID